MTPTLHDLLNRRILNRPSHQALMVGMLGPYGSGKSLALSNLTAALCGRQQRCATVDFRSTGDEHIDATYEFIVAGIDRDLGRVPTTRARARLEFVPYLCELVAEMPQPVVIAFDHLEHLSEETARQFVSDLREVQNHSDPRLGRLTCFLAGCLSLDDLKRRSNSPNLQFVSETFPLARPADRVARVEGWLSSQRWHAEPAAVKQLAEETGGEPHFLELAASYFSGTIIQLADVESAARRAVEGGGGSAYLGGIARTYWLDRQLRKQVTRLLDGQQVSYTQAAVAALNAGCDMVLLCNQCLPNSELGGRAVDELIEGLTEAQLKGSWQPQEAGEERRRALLPRTAAPEWDALMVQPDYMHALSLIP